MPNIRETLPEIVERNESQLAGGLGVPELPRRSVESVTARVVSGGEFLQQGRIDYLHRQRFVHLCDEEFLSVHADLYGVPRKSAEFAKGQASFAASDGVVVESGAEIQRSDGVMYEAAEESVGASGVVVVSMQAVDAGASGNCAAGTTVTLSEPVLGVTSSGVVADDIDNGVDEEDKELWRGRIQERKKFTPHAGNPTDYEEWAKEVAGVTRAWAYKGYFEDEPQFVAVTFVCDDINGGPIPTDDKVTEVLEHLESVCSATAFPKPFKPEAVTVNFDIRLSPDTMAVREAVELELRDLLYREGVPGATIPLSHFREAVSIASGEYDFTMTVPSDALVITQGQFPVFGTITWE